MPNSNFEASLTLIPERYYKKKKIVEQDPKNINAKVFHKILKTESH